MMQNQSKILKATHTGFLRIGKLKIPCAVLEDGTRVISETGIVNALGNRDGKWLQSKREGGEETPPFLAQNQLKPFVPKDFRVGEVNYISPQGNSCRGYPAQILPKVCEIWLTARRENALLPSQMKKAERAEILMSALAHVGITALVDEATGFQISRAKNDLQRQLYEWLAENTQPWQKTFPDKFYENLCRLWNLDYERYKINNPPQFFGTITNNIVYKRLAPCVLKEIKARMPKNERGGYDQRFHQLLSVDSGHPKLREHLKAVIALMKAADTKEQFLGMLDRALPIMKQDPDEIDLQDEEELRSIERK